MGGLISRRRKKPSTTEVLEKLDQDIRVIEKVRRNTLETERRLVGSLLLYSVIIYIAAALLFYFKYFPEQWSKRLLYSLPLLLFPLLIWGVKRFLNWYFIRRISRNETALEDLREKREMILDEVMEKETYKKAKEILQRFDPVESKNLEGRELTSHSPPQSPSGQELRHRGKESASNSPVAVAPASLTLATTTTVQTVQASAPATGKPGPSLVDLPPHPGPSQHNGQQSSQFATPSVDKIPHRRTSNPFGSPLRPPGPPMPRSILPRERSASERVLEYLIGDGPQNRYALICKQCHSHNGMAFKEEFDYLTFRCCYCYTLNPARRQRPHAPKLPTPLMPRRVENLQKDAEMETESDEDNVDPGRNTNIEYKKDK